MSVRFILREPWQGRIIPRPDLGLFPSRKQAKAGASRHGWPDDLIYRVRRSA